VPRPGYRYEDAQVATLEPRFSKAIPRAVCRTCGGSQLPSRLTTKGSEEAVPDNRMTDPGTHEDAALEELAKGRADEAQVRAILALASAVNRLAAAHENIAPNVESPRFRG
jgi:hypothetical protein